MSAPDGEAQARPAANQHAVQIILSQMPKEQEKDAIEVRLEWVNKSNLRRRGTSKFSFAALERTNTELQSGAAL